MKQLVAILFFSFLFISNVNATHNAGGYISYEYLSGNSYKISVNFYLDSQSPAINRLETFINFGDNSGEYKLLRDSMITHPDYYNLVKAVYDTVYNFPGPGNYTISVTDPNRKAGIENISNPAVVPVYIETQLRIDPLGTINNNSVEFLDFMPSSIVRQKTASVNLTAYDKDGDYLKYELVDSKGLGGASAPDYFIPQNATLDITSGQFTWTPQTNGLYQFTARVSEYRNGVLIASTLFDFLIFSADDFYDSDFIEQSNLESDSCGNLSINVSPGDTATFKNLYSFEENVNYQADINCISEIDSTDFTFDTTQLSSDSILSEFSWMPSISDVRCSPYPIYFRGSVGPYKHDLVVFVYVLDSTLSHCDTSCFIKAVGLSEKANSVDRRLLVKPNPFTSNCSIVLPKSIAKQNVQLEVYNSNGMIVESQRIRNNNEFIVERKSLASGIYFYRVQSENGSVYSGKLIIAD